MKTCQFASFLVALIFANTLGVMAQSENEILGTWYNTEKSAQIEIVKTGTEYLGKIIRLENEKDYSVPPLDSKNDNENLRSRPLKGLTILEGLNYSGGVWKGGKIYDPLSGKTYSCEVKLKSPSVLEVKGFIGFSWIGRTVEWTKVK